MIKKRKINFSSLLILAILFILQSCSVEPKEILFGEEDCDFCQMTISDERYGAELVTKKGRIYKFDDLHCLKEFINEERVSRDNLHSKWVVNFDQTKELIHVDESFLLYNEELKSPMGSNTAAFSSEKILEDYYNEFSGIKMTWEEFLALD